MANYMNFSKGEVESRFNIIIRHIHKDTNQISFRSCNPTTLFFY
jgi:hypothetical protein